jgi:alpha-1,6-mannosyltransferase
MSASATPGLRPVHWLLLLLSGVAYGALAYTVPRQNFDWLLGLLTVAFVAYAGLWRTGLPLRAGLGAALVLRLLWLPALPALSDDYHRFRWDGLLVANGVNPYQYRPDTFTLSENPSKTKADTSLEDSVLTPRFPQHLLPTAVLAQLATEYPLLNSPHYFSVYPPVCQAVFGAAAWLFPTNGRATVLLMRLVLLAAEIGTSWLLVSLLRAFGQDARRALLYLLNPLVLVELTGNLHFEALVIFLLLLMLWLLRRGRVAAGGVALGLAVATKFLPLLVLPLLLRRLGWRRFLRLTAAMGTTLAVVFAPFVSPELFVNISKSLNLYFRSFEFNASVYYVLRTLGQWQTGYNEIALIGPALALLTAAGGLLLAAREQHPTWPTLPRRLLLLLTLYYLLATTVHPWYLTPLVALSVFTRFRYALVWSGLAVLSYAAYRTSAYLENLWLVSLEYAVVLACLLRERRQVSRNNHLPEATESGETEAAGALGQ